MSKKPINMTPEQDALWRAKKRADYAAHRDKRLASKFAKAEGMREELAAKAREYRAKNPEKTRAATKKWQQSHKDRVVTLAQNRRARVRNAPGVLSSGLTHKLTVLQKGRCAVCRCRLSESGVHVDHIFPILLGGSNTDDNIQLLCPTCNISKNAKHPVEFMQQRGFLL